MIEVFKTNVEDANDAVWLLEQIGRQFVDYTANFDLEDCDRILRVQSGVEEVDVEGLIAILGSAGFQANILEGDAA